MTDPTGLTPEQEAVRRLLVDARHDGPTPPEVVARLDETLSRLVAERDDVRPAVVGGSSAEEVAPVVDLGARRRRMAGAGLLAAAAVVVAGVALGQVLPVGQDSDQSSSAGGSADSSFAESPDSADSGGQGSDSGAGAEQAPESSLKSVMPSPLAGLPTISTTAPDLADRLRGLRRDAAARTTGQPLTPDVQGACLMRGIGPGRRLLVEVDGKPGTVVYQPPSGDVQDVAIFVCGMGEPVRTLTLPAP